MNLKRSRLENLLKQLEVDGAVRYLARQGWERTLQPWTYPAERVEQVTAARRIEQAQMRAYALGDACRMAFLTASSTIPPLVRAASATFAPDRSSTRRSTPPMSRGQRASCEDDRSRSSRAGYGQPVSRWCEAPSSLPSGSRADSALADGAMAVGPATCSMARGGWSVR